MRSLPSCSWLAAVASLALFLLPAHVASARDYSSLPLPELHRELDRRPMALPIGVTIVGGISLIAGGYLFLYGLSFQAACQLNGQSCDNSTQIAVGGVMAGAGAITTTAGTIWLVTWDQSRREVSDEISRRKTTARLGAAPLFLDNGAGLRLLGTF